jgi:hypothetical protein
MTRDAGFSLVEVVMATTLTMSVTGAVVSLATPAGRLSPALPEAVDLQQRARVIENVLVQELARAGAGLTAGPWSGGLVESFAPVVPHRMGLLQADAFTAARADAITIRYVPDTVAQTTVSAFTVSSSLLTTTQTPGCPVAPLCGLTAGSDVFVFDRLGHASTFTVQQLQASTGVLDAHDVSATHAFQPGDAVAEAVSRTYYFDAAQRQLRQYDGNQSDAPVVDGVVGVTFSYFGDPNPPLAPRPALGTANCLYDVAGQLDPALTVLPSSGSALVALPLSMLADGPWCGTGGARFDADLLRIRSIHLNVRVEATQSSFRGQGADFAHPGLATDAWRALPDVRLSFDVAPRNMNLRR